MPRIRFSAVFLLSLVLAAGCAGKAQDERSKEDLAALQGEWVVIASESNGSPPPPGLLDRAKFVFSGKNTTLMGKEGTFELDASKNPHQIDFRYRSVLQRGIYELDDDCLKLCVGPADDRPTDYRTRPRTDHTMFLLKRKN